MKKCHIFVQTSGRIWKIFCELAEAIKLSMNNIEGWETKIVDTLSTDFGDLNIRIANIDNYFSTPEPRILIQTETRWECIDKGVYFPFQGYQKCNNFTRVLDFFQENKNVTRGTKNVVWFPIGYSPIFDGENEEKQEEIRDLFFYGLLNSRRINFINKIQEFIPKRSFYFIDNVFGTQRNIEIQKSKIVLYLNMNDDRWLYSPLHCIFAQLRKKIVFCEKTVGGNDPYKSGIHYIEFDGLQDLKDKVEYYLRNEKERNEFALNAYNDIKTNFSFDGFFKKSMKGLI